MAGTGRKGYTGASISDGRQLVNGSFVSTPSSSSSSGSGGATFVGNADSYSNNGSLGNLAANVAGFAGTDPSAYGDYIRQALELSANNTAASQEFAREQMDYQTQSNETAMAWSADQAQMNRDWQERLSNTAHQREVKDLVAAGLNPILSANQGAYTGAGATGQAFSASGAMGTVDMNGSAILGNMINTAMNTASNAYIAGLYNDTSRYGFDLGYKEALLNADTAILTNSRTTDATKYAAGVNAASLIKSATIQSEASRVNTERTASATERGQDKNLEGTKYSADQSLEGVHVGNWRTTTGAAYEGARAVAGAANQVMKESNLANANDYDEFRKGYYNVPR